MDATDCRLVAEWLSKRGITGFWVFAGRSEIVVVPASHLAVSGRADGRDVVVDGML